MQLIPCSVDSPQNLTKALLTARHPDPYVGSAAYHFLTGRRGLWLAVQGVPVAIVCRHPSIPKTALVFPLDTDTPGSHLGWIASQLRRDEGIRAYAGRVIPGADWAETSQWIVIEESTMDWRFPSHVLDTESLVQHQGHKLSKFRQKVSRANRTGAHVLDVEPSEFLKHARSILAQWSQATGRPTEASDPFSFYNFALDHMTELGLRFILTAHSDEPAAFALWEPPLVQGCPASTFVSLTKDRWPGASEHLHHSLAQAVLHDGHPELCVGGSEEETLDNFKQKMLPVRSISMKSAKWCA